MPHLSPKAFLKTHLHGIGVSCMAYADGVLDFYYGKDADFLFILDYRSGDGEFERNTLYVSFNNPNFLSVVKKHIDEHIARVNKVNDELKSLGNPDNYYGQDDGFR